MKIKCSSGLFLSKRGFTLIELLVVVLIIGILAAVALPQYNKAILKSRFAQIELDMRTMALAAEACQLTKGSLCTEQELDIDVPDCKPIPGLVETSCFYLLSNGAVDLYGRYSNQMCRYWFASPDNSQLSPHTLYCIADNNLKKVGFTKNTGTSGPNWWARPSNGMRVPYKKAP